MRIGINVPDDLLKRLEPFRQVTNVSQICRDAIESWVNTYEGASLQAQLDGVEDVADRLFEQYAEHVVDWEALGVEDAKLWVHLASLQDFEDLFHNLKILERQGRSLDEFVPPPHLKGEMTFAMRSNEHREWFIRQIRINETINHHEAAERAYTRSRMSYVIVVWQQVKDRVAADAKARLQSLENERKNIEIPNRLVAGDN